MPVASDLSQVAASCHNLDCSEAATLLESDLDRGLSAAAAADRHRQYGPNQLPQTRREHPLRLLAGQFRSLLVIILLLAAALAFIIWTAQGEEALPYDTIVIMAIVIANAALGFFQENRAEQSLEQLRSLSGPEATVIREGASFKLPAAELVPGDLIALKAGDKIAADARLCQAVNLGVSESALTGESATVVKSVEPVDLDAPVADRTDMIFAGTAVVHGRGRALVAATGEHTEVGKIAELLKSRPSRQTPLQQSLDQLGRRLGLVIVVTAIIVSATGLLVSGPPTGEKVIDMLFFGVALAVAAIPEGLPAVVTGALALGTQRMARRRAIVRKLPAVETLGSTTAICSDKTGTLTVGEMTAREVLVPAGLITLGGSGYRPEGDTSGPGAALAAAQTLAYSAVLCNDSALHLNAQGQWRAVGTPTEAALLSMAAKLGLDYNTIKNEHQRLAEEPFSSEIKKMSVMVVHEDQASLHLKGAPEALLPLCSFTAGEAGAAPLDGAERHTWLAAAADMASRGLRPLAIAAKAIEDPQDCRQLSACEHSLTFLGLVAIADPPRPEAAAAIKECRQAGIEVYMVTGDHLATAQSIAAELGIVGAAMTGAELDNTSDERLEQLIDGVKIFARVAPGHKVRIVQALQNQGQTVAVTGDGVNDAPALKQADIGVAMGISGTEVAKEAADMVLLDDNFATIVAAVEEGRSIFANIQKFLAFLLSSNSALVLTLFLGVLLAVPLGLTEDGHLLLPLLAVQVLWINLVTNGPPALALGVEPKDPEAMLAPPRRREDPVINRAITQLIVLVGLVAGLGGLVMLDAYFPGGRFTLAEHTDIAYARTMTFVLLTLYQLYNSLNCRSLTGSVLGRLGGNPWLLGTLALSTLMMVAVVHVPLLQRAFHTVPLAPRDWLIAALVGSSVLWAVELYRLLVRLVQRAACRMPLR